MTETPSLNPKRESTGWAGALWPIAILVLFTVLNFATGTRYPTAWQDEMLYTDPAANLFFGHGFTSSAWPAQPYGTFWAGNVPLHQFILAGWFHLFGFGLLSARSLNYVLIVVAVIVLWRGWRRLGLIQSNTFAALTMAVILCGAGITMSYRSARPDCLAILLAALAFNSFTIESARSRKIALLALGLFFPAAGIQLVIFACFLGALLVVWMRGKVLADFVFLGCGIAVGAGLLAALYAAHGVLDQFILGVTKYTNIGVPAQPLGARLRQVMSSLAVDKTQAGLVLMALGLWLVRALGVIQANTERIRFALTTWLVVIIGMIILGKFPVYYAWMTAIPLAICLLSTIESVWRDPRTRATASVAIIGVLVFSLPGLPAKMAATFLRWQDRDIAALDQYAGSNSKSADWLVADYQAYFSVKNASNRVFSFCYLDTATAAEKARIHRAIVQPYQTNRLVETLGGNWNAVAPPFAAKWPAVDSPNAFLRRFAQRLSANPQDADWQLCVFERVPESTPITGP